MSNIKSFAKSVLDGYNETLVRLAQRYNTAVSTIDKEHDTKNAEINNDAMKRKNSADASNKVALSNTQRGLLEKGLSRSGASVQAEIDSNLARNNAFSSIESDATRAKSENETARAKSKASALTDLIDSINDVESKKNAAYIAQLNADRQYEAERDDEKFDRYAENREYEAERDDEKFDRYAENREYEAERDDEKFDRYAENREYEAARDDEKFDRYAENREYEAERDDEKFDRYVENRDYMADRSDESFDRQMESREYLADRSDEFYGRSSDGDGTEVGDGDTSGNDGIVPEVAPKALVDKIKVHYENEYYSKKTLGKSKIRAAIETIINDESLSYTYRYQVKMYAIALSLY